MAFLLVDIDGCKIAREGERLVVRRGSQALSEYRPCEIESVIAWGQVELTRPALDMLLSRRIPVHLVARSGRYRGCLLPPEPNRPALKREQYASFADDAQRARFARGSSAALVRNLRTVVRRWAVHREVEKLEAAVSSLDGVMGILSDATTAEELRGAEGIAWRSAYEALEAILPRELGFRGRLRRPAPDPVNAILGLYGVMTVNHADAILRSVGLDPAYGYLHGSSRGGPALAMDLADVYRPMLCLAPAVTLFTKRMLAVGDFTGLGYSANLTTEGVRTAIQAYASASRRQLVRRNTRKPRDYLQHMCIDADNLASSLGDGAQSWIPLTIR